MRRRQERQMEKGLRTNMIQQNEVQVLDLAVDEDPLATLGSLRIFLRYHRSSFQYGRLLVI